MKIIKIFFSTLLALLLIVSAVFFIISETFDSDQYLPQIINKVSHFIGRPVSIGHLGVGVSSIGPTIDAGPVIIADDPGITQQPFIKIEKVRFGINIISSIFDHKIHISSIVLQSPQVHFIRSQEGVFNIHSLSPRAHQSDQQLQRNPTNNLQSSDYPAREQSSTPSNKQFTTPQTIIIQDGAISFIDQTQVFPLDIWLKHINARVDNFSLSKPFELTLDASLYNNAPNVHLKSFVTILGLPAGGEVLTSPMLISDLALHVELFQMDIDQLKGVSPELSDSSIFEKIQGDLQVNLNQLRLSDSGGLVSKGQVLISNGVIKDFNIFKILLSHALESFGGIEGDMDSFLSGTLKDKLAADDTVIQNADIKFDLHDKVLLIDDSLFQTNIFEFTAQGSVDQGLNADLQTMVHLNTDVSTSLVNELDGFKYLMDDSKRIAIGASLKGVIPHLKYKLNKEFRKKSKKALFEEGAHIFGALFGGR